MTTTSSPTTRITSGENPIVVTIHEDTISFRHKGSRGRIVSMSIEHAMKEASIVSVLKERKESGDLLPAS